MSKFLLFFSVFFLVTTGTAFGTVALDNIFYKGSSPTQTNQIIKDNDDTQEESDGEKLLNNLLTIDSTSLNLELELNDDKTNDVDSLNYSDQNNKIIVKFEGNLSLQDLENIKICGKLNISYENNNITLNIYFLDKTLYVSNETMKIKLEVESLSKISDLIPLLGINLDLGLDFSSIDTDAILANLQNIKAEKLDNGDLFMPFTIFEGLTLNIYTNDKYEVKNIQANNLKLAQKIINLNAGLEKSYLEITEPENSSEFTNVTKMVNLIDNAKEIITNKKLHLNVNASISDKQTIQAMGNLDIDFSSNPNVYASFNVNYNNSNYVIKLGYINDTLYLQLNDYKFCIEKDDFTSVLTNIFSLLNIDKTPGEILNLIKSLPKIILYKLKDLNFNKLIEIANNESDYVVTILGEQFGLNSNLTFNLSFDNYEKLSGIKVCDLKIDNYNLNLDLDYNTNANIPTLNKDEFNSYKNVEKFVKSILASINEIKTDKVLKLKINKTDITLNDSTYSVNGDIYANFADCITEGSFDYTKINLYTNLNLSINNNPIILEIFIRDERIFVAYGDYKISVKFDKINSIIELVQKIIYIKDNANSNSNLQELWDSANNLKIDTSIDYLSIVSEILPGIDVEKIISGDFASLKIGLLKNIEILNDKTIVTLDKELFNSSDDLSIEIKYNDKITDITIANLELKDIGVNGGISFVENINVPELKNDEFINIDSVSKIFEKTINDIVKILDSKQISLDLAGTAKIKLSEQESSKTELILDIKSGSKLKLDLSEVEFNENFDINKLRAYAQISVETIVNEYENETLTKTTTQNHFVEFTLTNGTIYLKYNKINAKISVKSLKNAINEVLNILNINLEGKLPEINFDKNALTNLSLDIVKSLTINDSLVSINLDLSELNLGAELNDIILNVVYTEKNIDKIQLQNVNTSIVEIQNIELGFNDYSDIVEPTEKYLDLNNIEELITKIDNTINEFKDNKELSLNLNNVEIAIDNTKVKVNGQIYANLKECFEDTFDIKKISGYANINVLVNTTELNLEMYVKNQRIYVSLGNLNLSVEFDKVTSIVELVQRFIYFKNELAKGTDKTIQSIWDESKGQIVKQEIDIEELIKKYLPGLDFSKIKNKDFASLDISWLENLSILSDKTIIELSKDLFNSDENLILEILFNNKVSGLTISNLNLQNVKVNGGVEILNTITVPTLNEEKYSSLDSAENLVEKTINDIVKILDSKQISLDLAGTAKIKLSEQESSKTELILDIKSGSKLKLDLSEVEFNENFDINKLRAYAQISVETIVNEYENETLTKTTTQNHFVEFTLTNGTIYLKYNKINAKISVKSLKNAINEVLNILNINLEGKLPEINFDKNALTNLSLDIVKSLTINDSLVSINLDLSELNLGAELNDIILNVVYTEKNIDKIQLQNVNTSIVEIQNIELGFNDYSDIVEPTEKYLDLNNIEELITKIDNTINEFKDNKELSLNLNNVEIAIDNTKVKVNGQIYANLKECFEDTFDIKKISGYANINVLVNTTELNLEMYVKNQRIYVSLGNLNLSVEFDKVTSIVELVQRFIYFKNELAKGTDKTIQSIWDESKGQIVKQEIDIEELIKKYLPGLDFSKIKNKDFASLDISWLENLSILSDKTIIELSKDLFNSDENLILEILFNNKVSGLTISNLNLQNVKVNGGVEILNTITVPTLNEEKYSSLDSAENLVEKTIKNIVDIIDNKHISIELQGKIYHTVEERDADNLLTKSTVTTINMLSSSLAKLDWSEAFDNGVFEISKLKAYIKFEVETTTEKFSFENSTKKLLSTVQRQHSIDITCLNGTIYLKYNKMSVKINLDSINNIVDTISKILNTDLSLNVSNSVNFVELLEKLDVNSILSLNLSDLSLNGILNLNGLKLSSNENSNVVFSLDYSDVGLDKIFIENFSLSNNTVEKLQLKLNEFDSKFAIPSGNYINLNNIDKLLDAISNTTEFTDFEISGNINLKLKVIGINIDWNIPTIVKAKIGDNKLKEASITIGPIPVVPGVNDDVPFQAGNITSGIYAGLDRILNIYIKDDYVYFYRKETVPTILGVQDRTYEKKIMIHIDTLLDDPIYYILQYGMGFSGKIKDAISEAINKERINPVDYSNVLVDFTSTTNQYSLKLNLKELAENDKLDTMTLTVGTTAYNNKMVVENIGFDMYMPVASSVEITLKSNDLKHINIGKPLDLNYLYDYINSYKYKEGAAWAAYNGDWDITDLNKFTLSFKTNCDQTVESMSGAAGARITLPVLNNYYVDSASERVHYIFEGWYTSFDCEDGKEYKENEIPRKNTILYAKWSKRSQKYITINFVPNGGENIPDLIVLENSIINLPTYFELLTEETQESIVTKQFDGWFTDVDLEIPFDSNVAPNENLTLFAKWSIVDSKETYTVNIYDNNEKVLTRRVLEGKNILVSGAKFKDTTKYYLDSTYETEIDINTYIMPNTDISIYIKNEYNVNVTSIYGNVINQQMTKYQGDKISLVSQNSYYFDDVTQTERIIYTFNGYFVGDEKITDLSNFVMPNADINIVASWNKEIKLYYEVSFNVAWAKPDSWKDNNSNVFGKITCTTAPTKVSSIRFLAGTEFDPSKYTSSCVYKYKAMGIDKSYKFVVHSWSTESKKQLSYNSLATSATTESYTVLTNLKITDDVELFAVWKYQK